MIITRRLMDVSKLTVSDKLKKQRSTYAEVLLWMREHPAQCRQVNAKKLAHAMKLDDSYDFLSSEKTLYNCLVTMQQKGFIERHNGVRRVDFYINYRHPQLPYEVREAMEEQPTTTEQTLVDVDERIREEIAESDAPGTEEPTAETVCPGPITVEADGNEIKLSITLNINIAR